MKTIVGLGNPGMTYRDTRHNVGFMVVQRLAQAQRVALSESLAHPSHQRPAAVAGRYQEGGVSVRLAMPLTMMNESGDALAALGEPAGELLVVCDDVNLPLGALRLRAQGGAGGHHGLASCLQALGTEQVARLRIGVGVAPLPRELHDFVLSPFRPEERGIMDQALTQAVEACRAWAKDGLEQAMNRFNLGQGHDD
ncbi:MAG: aminoacyl-tRNA hydrolase [Candidatus Omnitrophica bacterium]|nr:aminoacyl-tRNA hydrolase [Candidatus Omnitrophota bacterium]